MIDVKMILNELESLGTEQNKKIYMNHGAKEPLFGVATGAMKPLYKKIKRNYSLSMELYATGNYDAMYFAGMIADPTKMCEEDFRTWMVDFSGDSPQFFIFRLFKKNHKK